MSSIHLTSIVPVDIPEYPWIIVFLIAFSLLAWIKYSYPNRWSKTIRSTFNVRMTKQFMREEALLAHRSSAVFLFLFCITVGITIHLLLDNLQIAPPLSFTHLIGIIIGVIVLSLAHWGLHTLVAVLMKEKEAIGEYMFTLSLIHRTAILILLPLAFFMAYSSKEIRVVFIVPSILTLICILLYRIFRGLRIVWEVKVDAFYFILYLCALEILPLLLVGRGLMDFIS